MAAGSDCGGCDGELRAGAVGDDDEAIALRDPWDLERFLVSSGRAGPRNSVVPSKLARPRTQTCLERRVLHVERLKPEP